MLRADDNDQHHGGGAAALKIMAAWACADSAAYIRSSSLCRFRIARIKWNPDKQHK